MQQVLIFIQWNFKIFFKQFLHLILSMTGIQYAIKINGMLQYSTSTAVNFLLEILYKCLFSGVMYGLLKFLHLHISTHVLSFATETLWIKDDNYFIEYHIWWKNSLDYFSLTAFLRKQKKRSILFIHFIFMLV